MSPVPPPGREVKRQTIDNWEKAYRRGVLEVWKQRRRIRAGENCRICGIEQVNSSNAVDNRLNQAVMMDATKE